MAALLPAPADFALGRGPGLLAAVNGKQVGLEREGLWDPGWPLPQPPADPRPWQLGPTQP